MALPAAQPESYKKTQVESASPEALILMLYDGALRFMSQAEEAFAEKNLERIHNLLIRVQAIFSELLATLDKDRGGEIAKNLERLYVFFLEKLSDSNIRKDPEPMNQIRPLVENLRQTWAEAMKISARNSGVTSPAPAQVRLNLSA
ncbi:MAG: flagellar export chaperone FliS [Candidatus Riflebacteria bacterium]|nr:flagellar export chaperone FliS [Candidatus Riflebacteria bacterium]